MLSESLKLRGNLAGIDDLDLFGNIFFIAAVGGIMCQRGRAGLLGYFECVIRIATHCDIWLSIGIGSGIGIVIGTDSRLFLPKLFLLFLSIILFLYGDELIGEIVAIVFVLIQLRLQHVEFCRVGLDLSRPLLQCVLVNV